LAIAALMCLFTSGAGFAQEMSVDLGAGDGSFAARVIQVLGLVTILSLAPGILIMTTSFVRIVVVLGMLRVALGLQQSPPNMVIISLALFLTGYIMAPTFERVYYEGMEPLIQEQITEEEAVERMVQPMKDFMLGQVREQDLRLFQDLYVQQTGDTSTEAPPQTELPEPTIGVMVDENGTVTGADGGDANNNFIEPPLQVLIPAFMISELRRAFEIGFLMFLPFLIIDMVVASLLMSMGMMMLPPAIISLPFKVIFFVLIEGWFIVARALVQSFGVT
jgi:flagellar biosynthetic protein FliP